MSARCKLRQTQRVKTGTFQVGMNIRAFVQSVVQGELKWYAPAALLKNVTPALTPCGPTVALGL